MGRWRIGAGSVAVLAALACGGAGEIETVPVGPPPPVAATEPEEPGGDAVGDVPGEGPTSWVFPAATWGLAAADLSQVPAPVATAALALGAPLLCGRETCATLDDVQAADECGQGPGGPDGEEPTWCSLSLDLRPLAPGLYAVHAAKESHESGMDVHQWRNGVVTTEGVVIDVAALFPDGTALGPLVDGHEVGQVGCDDPESLKGGWWDADPSGLQLSTSVSHRTGGIESACDFVVPWEQALAAAKTPGPLDAFRDRAVVAALPGTPIPHGLRHTTREADWTLALEGAEEAPDAVREAALALACAAIADAPCAEPLSALGHRADGGPMGTAAVARVERDGDGWSITAVATDGSTLATARPSAAVTWPAPSLDGLPGWMGVRAGATDGPYWTHISGTTHLVVIGESWKDVPPGTVVDAVGPSGRTPVTFRGVQTARFGCDGGTELPVGAFEGEPPGDLVWLVPPGVALEAAQVTTVDGVGSRTWRVGASALGVKVLTPTTFALWAGAEDEVLSTTDMAEIAMDGWDPEPVDVTGDFFVPQVVGAWSTPGHPTFAASAWGSFEGIHFTVFVLGEPPTETEIESLYSCAF